MVEVEVSEGDVAATLPGGSVHLQVGGLNPQDESAWRLRLFNLGFLWDLAADLESDEMTIALEDFQAQVGLDPTGELDEATQQKLVEAYGC